MTLDDLYEDIKAAIKFLGINWDEKDQATIALSDGRLVITHGGRSVSITLPEATDDQQR